MEPIIVEVADTLLKQLNPQRTNIMTSMKARIAQLEAENEQLNSMVETDASMVRFKNKINKIEGKVMRKKSIPKG